MIVNCLRMLESSRVALLDHGDPAPSAGVPVLRGFDGRWLCRRRSNLDLDVELKRSNTKPIAGLDFAFRGDLFAVQEGAVRAAAVAHVNFAVAHGDAAVLFAHGRGSRTQLALRIATNDEVRGCDRYHFPGMNSLSNDKTEFHKCFDLAD